MKTTLFDEFMNANALKSADLPEPLRDKVAIYRTIHRDQESMETEDKKTLDKKLEALEEEIFEDVLEAFDDRLAHNEVVRKVPVVKPPADTPKEKDSEPKTPDRNEMILGRLYTQGKTQHLSRSFLKKQGLQVDYSLWEVPVGAYVLYRNSMFSLRFRLAKR